MTLDKTVLIVAPSYDPNWLHMRDALKERGFKTLVYEADRVSEGSVPLEITLVEGKLHVKYDGHHLDFSEVKAAWFRHSLGYELKTEKYRYALERNQQLLQNSLWRAVPENAWLNEPRRIEAAEHKLDQLQIAHQVGFTVPDTVVTNTWDTIQKVLPKSVIFKLPHGRLAKGKTTQFVMTTPYDNDISKLPTSSNPFPGLWQPNLAKAREWRVVVVGKHIFAGAIYAKGDAKPDWRRHAYESSKLVQFKKEEFPESQQKKCLKYLEKFGLRYGAFDFVEDQEGKITFLECNPNGQYGELENYLGLPVNEAIADELVKIARPNS